MFEPIELYKPRIQTKKKKKRRRRKQIQIAMLLNYQSFRLYINIYTYKSLSNYRMKKMLMLLNCYHGWIYIYIRKRARCACKLTTRRTISNTNGTKKENKQTANQSEVKKIRDQCTRKTNKEE